MPKESKQVETTKKKSQKVNDQENNDPSEEVKQLKSELMVTKSKIAEIKSLYDNAVKEKEAAERKCKENDDKVESMMKSFQPEDIIKLQAASVCFLRIFNNSNQTNEQKVPLTTSSPLVLVSPIFLSIMKAKLDVTGISSSLIFRKIIKEILPNTINYAECTRNQLLKDYNTEITAAFSKLD